MTGVPHPFVTLIIAGFWMVLTSFSLGQLLLGLVIGLIAGIAYSRLTPDRVRLRRPDLIVVLLGRVLVDIIRSNIAVARLILGFSDHERHSGFVRIPLDLTEPNALAVLAIILTATPGTAWIEFNPDNRVLLLHVFDLTKPEEWVHVVKNRYEAPLLEIFA